MHALDLLRLQRLVNVLQWNSGLVLAGKTVHANHDGFSSIDRNLIDTASILGASPWTVFRRIVAPLSRAAFLTSIVLTFTHTVGEFGVVLMVGGDIPGLTRTLSIAIYDQVQDAQYAAANRTSLWLVALSFLALLVIYARSSTREASLE